MAETILNYVSRRRNRSSGSSPIRKGDSPEYKKAKNTEDSEPQSATRTTTAQKDPHDEGEENDVVLAALEMTDDLGGILKQILEKLQKLDSIENTVKKIEVNLSKLETRTAKLESFQETAASDIEQLKVGQDLIEKNQEKAQKATAKKLEALDKKLAELGEKEKLIDSKIEELNTKDLYLEAYSRRENIKFNNIEESSPSGSREEDTEEVLRSFMERELGYGDARSVEIQRVHRLGKKRSDGESRPILARFLRSKNCDKILSLGHRLKGSNFQMFRDLPQELIRRRNLQMETFKKAKQNNIPASFSRAQPDKLYVRGKLWPVGQPLVV